MKKASIDIGSNSVLLLIADIFEDKIVELEDISRITFLGKNIDKNKSFDSKSKKDTFSALKYYTEVLEQHNIHPSDCIVTATEASRVATNAKEFFLEIKEKLGLVVRIISGEEEAFYSSYAVSLGIEDEDFVMMDIGGASTELIRVNQKPFKIVDSISLPVGASRAMEWIGEGVFEKKIASIISSEVALRFQSKKLVCVAGCMTSIGAMIKELKEYDPKIVNGMIVKVKEFDEFIDSVKDKGPKDLLKEYPFLGKRSEVMRGGEMIASHFINSLKVEFVQISTFGLRYGTAVKGPE